MQNSLCLHFIQNNVVFQKEDEEEGKANLEKQKEEVASLIPFVC